MVCDTSAACMMCSITIVAFKSVPSSPSSSPNAFFHRLFRNSSNSRSNLHGGRHMVRNSTIHHIKHINDPPLTYQLPSHSSRPAVGSAGTLLRSRRCWSPGPHRTGPTKSQRPDQWNSALQYFYLCIWLTGGSSPSLAVRSRHHDGPNRG